MASDKTLTRRKYSETKKAQVLAECSEPGASVAKVAMAHGINANVVHRWRQLAREHAPGAAIQQAQFIALPLPAATDPCTPTPAPAASDTGSAVTVELQRGATTLRVRLPMDCDSAAWLRELLA